MDFRESRVERERLTFRAFGESLGVGALDPRAGWRDDPEQALIVEEIKIGCTTGMLLCLVRDAVQRMLGSNRFPLTLEAQERDS
jgi:hypothetical protein